MSFLLDLAIFAVKAVSGARSAARLAGHETPALDEAHQALGPVRQQLGADRAQDAGAALGSSGQNDPADADDGGVIDSVLDWLGDLF